MPVTDVYQLIAREYGFDTVRFGEGLVANAAATAVRFLRQDPTRIAFIFMNLSANPLGILPMGSISATRQIVVPANGLATFNWRDDLHLPALEWFVLGSAALEDLICLTVNIDPASLAGGA